MAHGRDTFLSCDAIFCVLQGNIFKLEACLTLLGLDLLEIPVRYKGYDFDRSVARILSETILRVSLILGPR